MNYLSRRHIRSNVRQLLREARHIRNLRQDVADQKDLEHLAQSEKNVREAIDANDWQKMKTAGKELDCNIQRLVPQRPYQWLRDNLEIIIVAVAVAMAFRTYIVQPFKIPTSSMSPTLYGIHYIKKSAPDWSDRFPIKLLKLAILGERYIEVRARASGIVRFVEKRTDSWTIVINGIKHPVYNMCQHISPGDVVFKGQLLASGLRIAGDHILVNKIRWNFLKPKRGEIMVFKTNGIDYPHIEKNVHYVKRMVGLPHEKLSISEPFLKVDGRKITKPTSILRIENRKPGYSGYIETGSFLQSESNAVQLGADEYFACGDNQSSSLDSRYWGTVPKKNLVGPTFFEYWPLARHWGLTDR